MADAPDIAAIERRITEYDAELNNVEDPVSRRGYGRCFDDCCALLAALREAQVKATDAEAAVRALVEVLNALVDEKADYREAGGRLEMPPVNDPVASTAPDPRDPDPSRPGIFRDHNCWRCKDGREPCVTGNPQQCEYPHARND